MNGGGGPPSMPIHPGRGGGGGGSQHEIPYSPQHHGPYPPQPYNQHPQYFRQPYYQQQPPPQQWAYYPSMQPMYRPYPHQHQAMMAAPYPMPVTPQSLSPLPLQNRFHHPSTRPPQAIYSPSPPQERPMHRVPSPATLPPTAHIVQAPQRRVPWYPPLPWYSDTSTPFPPAARKGKRRFAPQSSDLPVELPPRNKNIEPDSEDPEEETIDTQVPEVQSSQAEIEQQQTLQEMIYTSQTLPVGLEVNTSETPVTSQAPSENNSTQPTTPSSTQPPRSSGSTSTVRANNKLFPVVPVVPHIPGLSKSRRKDSASTLGEVVHPVAQSETDAASEADNTAAARETESGHDTSDTSISQSPHTVPKAAPKSWADLVRSKAPAVQQNEAISNHVDPNQSNGTAGKATLADLLKKFSIEAAREESKLAFVKPRGLVNTGNMCYMNSVLQVLLYCTPFYTFLDQIGKHASHSFKSETPMVDAMILFIREFPIIDAASTAEQLRQRLKNEELEQYGESFTPEFVYEVIRRLPRFSTMRRGHQQDAEEFLGFLLEELHEECVRSMKGSDFIPLDDVVSPVTESSQPEDGWLEVGPKQRAAITRSSGNVSAESPVNKIFGGKLRSEFRVPGTKNSVTLEPYQSLQLDIGSPQINNIIDALKGLTRSEIIHGDFNSPRGPGVSATKQVFIETLPPVLILHLKRFQYDNTGGTQKIWKKVGYPLELEIPKEVFPQHKRGGFAVKGGLPKYRLISVVYHHGKSASGGHYTVDIRRQDGLEWIRLDDTVIRRVRSEDVAEGGSEEDPKILAAALEQHKKSQSSSSNIFDQVREEHEESTEAEKGWSHVNGSSHGGSTSKKWSGVVNGSATPTLSSGKRTPVNKFSVKDNKVAYILFYQRING